MSDLVKRLRTLADHYEVHGGAVEAMEQAADQLERYEAFVAKVRAARFYGHYECADYHADLVDKALAELDG